MLDMDSIIVDSKSGVSGAGRSLSIGSHYCEVNESFKAYKVATHRHNPEIDSILTRESGKRGQCDVRSAPDSYDTGDVHNHLCGSA